VDRNPNSPTVSKKITPVRKKTRSSGLEITKTLTGSLDDHSDKECWMFGLTRVLP